MGQPWVCPACATVINPQDRERAQLGLPYFCRNCGVVLIIDRKLDIPVLVEKPTS
jgi:hypothetical protein